MNASYEIVSKRQDIRCSGGFSVLALEFILFIVKDRASTAKLEGERNDSLKLRMNFNLNLISLSLVFVRLSFPMNSIRNQLVRAGHNLGSQDGSIIGFLLL